MKALTVRQPFADAIVQPAQDYGKPKRTENRSRPLPPRYIGVPVLLHAAKEEYKGAVLCRGRDWPDQRGVILGVVRFTGSHQDNETGPLCCAPWGFPDAWHWDIDDDVIRLDQPVRAVGSLGFWTPDEPVLAAVHAQLPEHATT